MGMVITWEKLPATLEEMKALPQAALKDPADTAALTVAALCVYPKDKEESLRMLDFLRGPRPLSPMEKQFIRDRFMDSDYVPRSYFKGAVPANDYKPDEPYTLEFTESTAQMADEGYKILLIQSGGADSKRQITLRNKPSTGEWFLWEQMLLVGIRVPQSQDAWA